MDHITTQVARWSLTVKPFGVASLLDRLRITLSNRDRTRPYETINITIKMLVKLNISRTREHGNKWDTRENAIKSIIAIIPRKPLQCVSRLSCHCDSSVK